MRRRSISRSASLLQCMSPVVGQSGSAHDTVEMTRLSHRSGRRCSAIPSLHDNLPCDFSALEFDHRRTEHLGSIGIRTSLRESETVAYSDTVFDLVSHVASADILKIGRDGAFAFQVEWLARRM